MSLNKSTGNMYDFVTHTWNTVKGECPHGCSYCYMHRWGKQKLVHFDERELQTDLGNGNFIFVGSSCDLFAESIPTDWIRKTINHCCKFKNHYLFQTKNPQTFYNFAHSYGLPNNVSFCTTLETNKWIPDIMKESPIPSFRSYYASKIGLPLFITIEPIMDFDLDMFIKLIFRCVPIQVNIGADSGNNHLPEPSKEKILELITELEKFTIVKQKSNLKRLLK